MIVTHQLLAERAGRCLTCVNVGHDVTSPDQSLSTPGILTSSLSRLKAPPQFLMSHVQFTHMLCEVTWEKKVAGDSGSLFLINNEKPNQDGVHNVIISTDRFIDRQILLDNVSADDMKTSLSFTLS